MLLEPPDVGTLIQRPEQANRDLTEWRSDASGCLGGEWGWIAGAEALRQRGALCVLNRVVGGQRGDSACREVGDSVRFYSEMGNRWRVLSREV